MTHGVCRSLGCTVIEMLTTHPPFHNLGQFNAMMQIKNVHYGWWREHASVAEHLPQYVDDDIAHMLDVMLQREAADRPTAAALLAAMTGQAPSELPPPTPTPTIASAPAFSTYLPLPPVPQRRPSGASSRETQI